VKECCKKPKAYQLYGVKCGQVAAKTRANKRTVAVASSSVDIYLCSAKIYKFIHINTYQNLLGLLEKNIYSSKIQKLSAFVILPCGFKK